LPSNPDSLSFIESNLLKGISTGFLNLIYRTFHFQNFYFIFSGFLHLYWILFSCLLLS
jgi:hypothetical protein